MTPPYDDVETLLVDTFAAHEYLADPESARALVLAVEAPPRRRRYAVLAAAAAVVLAVGGLVGVRLTRSPVPATDRPGAPARVAADTYAAHRAAAADASARFVRLVPLPARATRLGGRPRLWPEGGRSLEPSDPTLTRTAWWSVPATADVVERHLLAHTPPGGTREDGVGGGSHGVRDVTYDVASRRPAAYPGVSLLVQWVQVGDRTLVRADTYTAAYRVRAAASYLTGTVTAVDVGQVVRGDGARNRTLPTVHLAEPADTATVAALVATYDGLRASTGAVNGMSCPFLGSPLPSLTLTFHTAAGVVRAYRPQVCGGQVEVTRDGRTLAPTLEPGGLVARVDRLLSRR